MENFEINKNDINVPKEYLPIRDYYEMFLRIKAQDVEKSKHYLNSVLNELVSMGDNYSQKHQMVLDLYEKEFGNNK